MGKVSVYHKANKEIQSFMLTITPVINTFSCDSMQSCKKLSTPLDSIGTFSSKNFKEYISIFLSLFITVEQFWLFIDLLQFIEVSDFSLDFD